MVLVVADICQDWGHTDVACCKLGTFFPAGKRCEMIGLGCCAARRIDCCCCQGRLVDMTLATLEILQDQGPTQAEVDTLL
jgi:hypothetical protein